MVLLRWEAGGGAHGLGGRRLGRVVGARARSCTLQCHTRAPAHKSGAGAPTWPAGGGSNWFEEMVFGTGPGIAVFVIIVVALISLCVWWRWRKARAAKGMSTSCTSCWWCCCLDACGALCLAQRRRRPGGGGKGRAEGSAHGAAGLGGGGKKKKHKERRGRRRWCVRVGRRGGGEGALMRGPAGGCSCLLPHRDGPQTRTNPPGAPTEIAAGLPVALR